MAFNPTQINRFSPQEIRDWLRDALQDKVPLPKRVRDEEPFVAILRAERELNPIARYDLREACRQLMRELLYSDTEEPAFISALLSLCLSLSLDDVGTILAEAVRNSGRFSRLSDQSQKRMVSALVDFRTPVGTRFWFDLISSNPLRFSAAAVSGLLATDLSRALLVLPMIPDQEAIADAVVVKLRQAFERLSIERQSDFVAELRETVGRCQPDLRAALGEWLRGMGHVTISTVTYRFDSLAAVLRQRGDLTEPVRRHARLLAV